MKEAFFKLSVLHFNGLKIGQTGVVCPVKSDIYENCLEKLSLISFHQFVSAK